VTVYPQNFIKIHPLLFPSYPADKQQTFHAPPLWPSSADVKRQPAALPSWTVPDGVLIMCLAVLTVTQWNRPCSLYTADCIVPCMLVECIVRSVGAFYTAFWWADDFRSPAWSDSGSRSVQATVFSGCCYARYVLAYNAETENRKNGQESHYHLEI